MAAGSFEYQCRRGRTWFLHAQTTSSGRKAYYFSMEREGDPVDALPEGYEVFEKVDGQVFLRKKGQQVILPAELKLVKDALRRQGSPCQFEAEVRKKAIIVYESGNMEGLEDMVRVLGWRGLTDDDRRRHASYTAVMRFTLSDKKSRSFTVERYCFRGRIEDWILLDGPDDLAKLVRQFAKHLGRQSFFDLF